MATGASTKRERTTSPEQEHEPTSKEVKRAKGSPEAPSKSPSIEKEASKMSSDDKKMDVGEDRDSKELAAAEDVAAPVNAEEDNGADANAQDSAADAAQPEPQPIAMRCLIISGDASIIIGKGGKHINEIRDKSGARLTISEHIPSNPERILTVAGQLDAVSKAFGLIVRRINDEPFEQPSVPGSRAVTIRFIVPHARMGSVIGKGGTKIKEIQEASGARLTAGEAMLPNSTERVLSISGVADAVHIAVYYVGTILLEHSERNSHNIAYQPTSGATATAAMAPSRGGAGPYGQPGAPGGFGGGGYGAPGGGAPASFGNNQIPPGSQTQQIFIPNDLVGCIIGKGGSKINEIRQMSASHIKIMEPGAGIAAGGSGSERLVTITGPPANIQLAVSLLYQRLEQEKMRLSQGGAA